MTDTPFTPTIFVKQDCPFCLKLRIFLLESGLLDTVTLREFVPGTDDEAAIRAELDGRVEKITFPTAELAPGEYLSDSDAIIARLAGPHRVDPATLPTYRAYLDGPLKRMQALYVGSMVLKKQIG
jgi:hypothetical protein